MRASIIAGPDVKLVNLSRGGALMEGTARYPMRSTVRLKLTRSTGEVTPVTGTVSWAKVASIANGKLNYLVAVIFEKPIDLAAVTGRENLEHEVASGGVAADAVLEPSVNGAADDSSPSIEPIAVGGLHETVDSLDIEEELSDAIAPVRDNLTPFPGALHNTPQSPAPSPSPSPAAADGRGAVEREQALAEHQALVHTLSARLETLEAERSALRGELASVGRGWDVERSALTAEAANAVARANELQQALAAREQEQAQAVTEARMQLQTLQERLDVLDAERGAWSASMDGERRRWEDERSALSLQAAEALARADALQQTLQSRQDEYVQALAGQQALTLTLTAQLEALDVERIEACRALDAEQSLRAEEQKRYEGLVAELMQAANDQQSEYEALIFERSAALDDQVARAAQLHAELERHRTDAALERASLGDRVRELEARLEAAEAVSTAHASRYRAVRREAERLISLLTAPASEGLSDTAGDDAFRAGGDSAQAVAGG